MKGKLLSEHKSHRVVVKMANNTKTNKTTHIL